MRKRVLCIALLAASAAASAAPAWIDTSNKNTQKLLEAQAKFDPEDASSSGLTQYDGQSIDLGPNLGARYVKALQAVRVDLAARLKGEKDASVKQDLAILIGAIDDNIEDTRVQEKTNLFWMDVPKFVFGSMHSLLQEQLPEARRAKALERLKRYVGMVPGTTPLTELAKARFKDGVGKNGLRGPVKARVENSLEKVATYVKGIHELFATMKIAGADEALAALDKQMADYAEWERSTVLPRTRADFRLTPEEYALRLKRTGIDIEPTALLARAQSGYMETRAALQSLAPFAAKELGLPPESDYRAVVRAMKKQTIANERLETHYKGINTKLEQAIVHEHVVDLPQRAMLMRLASAAESAAQPAPHMQPPPLIGNTGEYGQFVLPVGNPSARSEQGSYDDFNFPAAAWTLSAHEGRPGHELQFTAMVERGVSQARMLYAFNSVNVEGWALYAEAEMQPYEPVQAQMITLQFRLLRAARAMLDPMLNLGLISREAAGRVLTEEVMLSAPMAKQELDRYTLNMPGQAGSYFYGYQRIQQLRIETELALGSKFDRLAFNNFLLSQGLLPPSLLAAAVREQFIPAQLGQPAK
jgi:uncharacterized protein (DUF885 family)